MKINGFGPHCNSGLSPRAGGVACLALWRALVRAVRKQLLTLPGRTLFKSLFCSKELCCLTLFFLNMLDVAPLVLSPAASLFTAGLYDVSTLGKGAVQIAHGISPCVGVRARPGRSHSISNWRSSSLGGRDRSGEVVLSSCHAQITEMTSLNPPRKERHAQREVEQKSYVCFPPCTAAALLLC